MSEETTVEQPRAVLQPSTHTPPRVLSSVPLSPQDKYVLYAVLRDVANELRRIQHEEKHQTEKG